MCFSFGVGLFHFLMFVSFLFGYLEYTGSGLGKLATGIAYHAVLG